MHAVKWQKQIFNLIKTFFQLNWHMFLPVKSNSCNYNFKQYVYDCRLLMRNTSIPKCSSDTKSCYYGSIRCLLFLLVLMPCSKIAYGCIFVKTGTSQYWVYNTVDSKLTYMSTLKSVLRWICWYSNCLAFHTKLQNIAVKIFTIHINRQNIERCLI